MLVGVIASPEGAKQSQKGIASSLSLLAMTQPLPRAELLPKISLSFPLKKSMKYLDMGERSIYTLPYSKEKMGFQGIFPYSKERL
ncbi:MAG: hypothetical protein A3G38_04445 [Omnitrophica WOR_2 bacterium RIFCSPLOWO2_12_FULL_51_8]|nr:MAG: hypothetical protein A3G38_04445 [Omnitrophica WOR_2 bacterium RIFCSPLOWO2_12_FULL_51_8]